MEPDPRLQNRKTSLHFHLHVIVSISKAGLSVLLLLPHIYMSNDNAAAAAATALLRRLVVLLRHRPVLRIRGKLLVGYTGLLRCLEDAASVRKKLGFRHTAM